MRITLQLNKEALMKLKQISLTLVSMLAAAVLMQQTRNLP
jgi:hypothetical protein